MSWLGFAGLVFACLGLQLKVWGCICESGLVFEGLACICMSGLVFACLGGWVGLQGAGGGWANNCIIGCNRQ